MSRSIARFASMLCALLALVPSTGRTQAAAGYHVVASIPVGGEGGWDDAIVDPVAKRLYVSHATKAVVIDLASHRVVGEVTPANGIHGIALAPELGRGFTSNGRDTTVTIFDLVTLATVGRVAVTGANPDAIVYDSASRSVFTFNGRGENATVIDAATGTVVGTIPLGGKPEFPQVDGRGLLYVNIEDTHEIVVIDTRERRVTARYALEGCEEPTGLALDRANTRLMSVCTNAVMIVSDPVAWRVIATIPIGHGVDGAMFDPTTRLVFASNGADGTMSVVRQESADRYTALGDVVTRRGSRTLALDPVTHRLYLASAEYGPVPPTAAGGRPARAPMLPGSFAVLVVDR
ncbi:MAG: YncE family protein [Gemmatimonadaceae bacterium]